MIKILTGTALCLLIMLGSQTNAGANVRQDAIKNTEAQAWSAWRNGEAVLIMRHALAPGTGDPANFALGHCNTQRNLNVQGQQQAHAWRRLLRQQYSDDIRVYSSEWCRCIDTAKLLQLGEPTPLAALNSFFAGRGDGRAQTRQLQQLFSAASVPQPVVLVSHQVNITELTGVFPHSAEGLILALPLGSPVVVLARITLP